MTLKIRAVQDDHKNRYFVTLGIAVAVLGMLMLLVREHTLTGFELDVFRAINNRPDSWHTIVEIISETGLLIGALFAVVAACFHYFKLAWRLVASMGAAYIAALMIKMLVDRPRPLGMLEQLHVRVTESGAGFPSAHATIATVALLTIFPYLPKMWRWIVIPVGILLVALSRVYLGVHSPYDVLAGIALGVIVVSVVRILPRAVKVFFRID